jgi:Uma2 family endonuclease
MSTATPTTGIEYPSSDGQPMAETWIHVRAIMWLHQALEDFFRDRPDVFVASDIFWYWEEGNPAACVSPDVMVVPGVHPRDPRDRRSFFSWEEGGAVPAAVFEMASESTWQNDLEDKFDRYEELGVREYFLFDPEGLYLVPVLQGYRLRGAAYRRIRTNALESELGFRLRAEDTMLRLIDGRTGLPIPTRAEAVEAAEAALRGAEAAAAQAEAARLAEKARADALAAEVERLKNLLGGAGP